MNQSESSLPASLFSTALQGIRESVIITNSEGIVLDWDSHAETIFGWARGEMIGEDLHNILHKHDLETMQEELDRLTQSPQSSERPYTALGRHRSGKHFALEYSVQALSIGSNSEPSYNFCIFIRDIEQFKDGYAELRRRERRYRILSYFASSIFGNDTIDEICWDIAQNCIAEMDFEDAVVYLLDAERNVLVQSATFGKGKEANSAVLNPIEIPMGQGIVGAAALQQTVQLIWDTTLDPRYIVDDMPRLSELAVPILYKGTTIGVIDSEHSRKNFFTDEDALILQQMAGIAATKIVRIRAEEQVRMMNDRLEHLVQERTQELYEANKEIQRQMEILAHQAQEIEYSNVELHDKNEQLSTLNSEMDAASRFKTEILSIVAHDLKNPLGAVITFADLALHDVAANSPAQELLQRIAHSASYMFSLTTQLLEAAVIDLGKMTIVKHEISLSAFVRTILESSLGRSAAKSQTILVETEPFVTVMGDEGRLHQVIENLVSNAVKYSPHGTTIRVCVRNLKPSERLSYHNPDIGYARLEIHDEGPGFSEEDKAKAFQFFQRLSAMPTGGESSHGVGLALVKKIVEAHNGFIRLESESGRGTTFIVELPTA